MNGGVPIVVHRSFLTTCILLLSLTGKKYIFVGSVVMKSSRELAKIKITRQRVLILVIDVVSLLLFVLSLIWDSEIRYWFFLSSLFLTFIGYHIVSTWLTIKLAKEEIDIICDEVIEQKKQKEAEQ